MLSSLAVRLKALSPFQLALLVLAALALLGSSTAVASNMITGADVKDRSLTGQDLENESVLSHDIKDGHVRSEDIRDGAVKSEDLSKSVREQLAENAELRADGKDGVDGKDGAKGAKGDTGAQGPAGTAGLTPVTLEPLTLHSDWTVVPGSQVGYYRSADGVVRLTGLLECHANPCLGLVVVSDGMPRPVQTSYGVSLRAWTGFTPATDGYSSEMIQVRVGADGRFEFLIATPDHGQISLDGISYVAA